MQFVSYPPSASLPNGAKETYNLVLTENADQALVDNVFYGSLQTFQAGKYDSASFWLDNHTAGVGDSCQIRFGLYDSSFNLLREANYFVDQTTTQGEEKIMTFPEIQFENAQRLFVVFGKNDEIGTMNVDSARAQIGENLNLNLIFTFPNPVGSLPVDISAIRAVGTRVFYNAIFKQ